ncbi:sugar phosphate isomerase/epimerase [Skermanella aerolata]|uniref:sugar phosphate isomerase/epimerase family protein n=1 Tax=Skermanella aerolata TaxID=393310 RepID=UPI003D22ED78
MTAISLSLSHLSALDLAPPELVSVAAAAGYRTVGLRLNPAAPGAISYPLGRGTVALAETLRRMKDTGVAVYDVEFVPLTPDIDVGRCASMFETAAELGAQRVNVSGDDPDFARLSANFAGICELAGTFGLAVDLEFMRWRHVGSLPQAAEIVRRAGSSNGAILLDALHLFRSGGSAEAVRALEPGLIHSVQLCDAPAEAPPPDRIIDEARNHRLPPGQGELPLAELVKSLPAAVAFAVEVPVPQDAGISPFMHVRKIREATESLLTTQLMGDITD